LKRIEQTATNIVILNIFVICCLLPLVFAKGVPSWHVRALVRWCNVKN